MPPVEAYIEGRFCAKTGEGKSRAVIHTKPSYFLSWSGDESKDKKATITREGLNKNKNCPLVSVPLRKVGEEVSTSIEVMHKSEYFPFAFEVESKKLTLRRVK